MYYKEPFLLTLAFALIMFEYISFYSCNQPGKNKDNKIAGKTFDSTRIKDFAESYQHGETVFQNSCKSCHFSLEKHRTDDQVFMNLFEHLPRPPEQYFSEFINDSRKLKSSGDKYAIQLACDWNSSFEHIYKDSLSKQDIDNLIIFIKVAIKKRQ